MNLLHKKIKGLKPLACIISAMWRLCLESSLPATVWPVSITMPCGIGSKALLTQPGGYAKPYDSFVMTTVSTGSEQENQAHFHF